MCYVPSYLRGSRCLGDVQEGSTVSVPEGVSLEGPTPERHGYRAGETQPSFDSLHAFEERAKTERAKFNLQLSPSLSSTQGGLQVGTILALRGAAHLRACLFLAEALRIRCAFYVLAALGKSQNERGPFRGPASWPNRYSVRRYNELLSYGHNILAECSGNVMRMCGFGGYSRTCSPPS